MLKMADAVRILGPDCELTTEQIGQLLDQLHVLALFVMSEMDSRTDHCHDLEEMICK